MREVHFASSTWTVADDPEEVHELLRESDAAQAMPEAPVPVRSMETTRRRVADGSVHGLRLDGELAAMITVTWEPPSAGAASAYSPARKPAYISRLAVRPQFLEQQPLAGASCIRRAIEVCASGGADVLRSEANPDLEAVMRLLRMLGFERQGPVHGDGVRRWVHLEKRLAPPAG